MKQPQLIQTILEKNFQHQINQDNLLGFIKKNKEIFENPNEFLQVHFFKDGLPYKDFTLKDLLNCTDYNQIPCSVRITNIHILLPEISKTCMGLYKKHETTFSCNLYLTPGNDKNCFKFHVDDQITYIYQVSGSKKWIWPVKDQTPFTFIGANIFNESLIENMETESIILKQDDQLYVPLGTVHKVEFLGDSPSIHLTFGSTEYFWGNCLRDFMNYSINEASLGHLSTENISANDFERKFEEIHEKLQGVDPKKFIKEFKNNMFLQGIKISKSGRSYSQLKGMNND